MYQSAKMHGFKSDLDQNVTALLCKFASRHYADPMSDPHASPEEIGEWSDEKLLAEWIQSDSSSGDPVANAFAAEAKSRGWISGASRSVKLRDKMRSMTRAVAHRFSHP
ncbi:hypothetical protein [uncultured Sphingomonas sp.]|uniref:hypothetical protein n=1 Tax=uncultured Sphingomonas sp. TaxID=158754 RepID=UPI0025DFA8EC|nr:hypothetical protein [uncultured Sphingomonas sp.]